MREKMKQLAIKITVVLGLLTPVMPVVVSVPAMALAPAETLAVDKVDTNLFGEVEVDSKGTGITRLLQLIVNILLYGIGIAAVVGVVVAGILYLTARDNEAQVAKAKTRLIEVVIGLLAWAMLFTLLRWLIPGFTGNEIQ